MIDRTIGTDIDEVFASHGPSAMIPTDMIPALSAQFASHRDLLRAHEQLHAHADRAENVLEQLTHLYTRGVQRETRPR